MEEYNKLEKLIDKYLYECDTKKIHIMTSEPNNELVKLILKNYKMASLLDKQQLDKSCIIILHLQKYDDNLIKFINEQIDSNIIFLAIVPIEFNFDYFIKNVKSNSIDANYWRKDGIRYKNYIITIGRD